MSALVLGQSLVFSSSDLPVPFSRSILYQVMTASLYTISRSLHCKESFVPPSEIAQSANLKYRVSKKCIFMALVIIYVTLILQNTCYSCQEMPLNAGRQLPSASAMVAGGVSGRREQLSVSAWKILHPTPTAQETPCALSPWLGYHNWLGEKQNTLPC